MRRILDYLMVIGVSAGCASNVVDVSQGNNQNEKSVASAPPTNLDSPSL